MTIVIGESGSNKYFYDSLTQTLMSAIFILIGASLVVASGFLIAFIRAVRNGQFEDVYTPSVRILFDDEIISEKAGPASKVEHEKTSTKI